MQRLFESIDVVEALRLGLVGLAFLLAFLAFWLLWREQRRETIRRAMLVSVYVFMLFSLLLCALVLWEQVPRLSTTVPRITWDYRIDPDAPNTTYVWCTADGKDIGLRFTVRDYADGLETEGLRKLCAGIHYEEAISTKLLAEQ